MQAVVALNRALRLFELEVRRKPAGLIRSDAEMKLTVDFVAAHFESRTSSKAVTVLEVGGFDGSANDPLLDAVQRFGWNMVVVEPQPAPYRALAELHAGSSRIQTFQVAVDSSDRRRAMYSLEDDSRLPDWARQISSFNREHLERQASYAPGVDLVGLIRSDLVECLTFDSLLAKAAVERVDILQIDTEGYDYELLHAFDVPTRLPAIINYEHEHLTRSERRDAVDLLISCGYKVSMASGGFDTVAYRMPHDPQR